MNSLDIVIRGGTAGSAIASRLSEKRDTTVLLLEAGPLDGPETMKATPARPVLIGSDVNWEYRTVPQPGLGGSEVACR